MLVLSTQRLGHVEHAAAGLTDDAVVGIAEKLIMNDPTNGHFITIDLYQITIVNDSSIPYSQVDEVEVLNKYTEIRELGYEFKPLESDDVLFQQHLLFATITVILFISLAFSALGLAIGLREHTVDIHPMDRSALSNAAGKILLGVGTFWFAVSPFLGLLGAVMMAYGHAHAALQNKGIEAYTNANIGYFDLNNLIDFLTDLRVERMEVNDANCTLYAAPLEAMWMCLLLISWFSLSTSFIAIRHSKCFLRTSAKFSWDPSETYSTIPDKRKISMPFPGVFISKGY
ncbi:hypothetical protein AAVH_13628 [Aphelenchoides avenae]|nr:hypothetical protein AAVH_13628 [Aphelenchus avenae]